MQPASQEVRTFFVSSVTWGRRSIFHAEPLARLFLDTLSSKFDSLATALEKNRPNRPTVHRAKSSGFWLG